MADDEAPFGSGETSKPLSGPVSIEQAFRVDGQKLIVTVQFPANVAQEIGMENLVFAANRAIVSAESKGLDVKKVRGG